jgi:hypothetical protein
VTVVIIRSRPDRATARPFLARANPIRHNRSGSITYRPLWTGDKAQALALAPAEARSLLRWLRTSRLAAGYQYGAPALDEKPARPDAEGQAARFRLVLEALSAIGPAGSERLGRHCGLTRFQTLRALRRLEKAGAVTRGPGQANGSWRATTPYLTMDAETFDKTFWEPANEQGRP